MGPRYDLELRKTRTRESQSKKVQSGNNAPNLVVLIGSIRHELGSLYSMSLGSS